MFHWKTEDIERDLRSLPSVEAVTVGSPGGDHDTSNIHVTPVDSEYDLHVCGFHVEVELSAGDVDDCDVEMVEMTDGWDSRGGLNVSCSAAAQCFFEVRQYFMDKGVDVVPQMRDYF